MRKRSDMPTPQLLSSIEVCELVGFDRSTLSRWIKDGTAQPAMRLPGKTGAYLFTPEEAARLAELFKGAVA
jgi:predicted site-specific integrase-resolvase